MNRRVLAVIAGDLLTVFVTLLTLWLVSAVVVTFDYLAIGRRENEPEEEP